MKLNMEFYTSIATPSQRSKSFCMPEMYHSEWKMCKATKTFPKA